MIKDNQLYDLYYESYCQSLDIILDIAILMQDKKEFTKKFQETNKIEDLMALFCIFPDYRLSDKKHKAKIITTLARFANKCIDKIDEFDAPKMQDVYKNQAVKTDVAYITESLALNVRIFILIELADGI